jgi:aquaporin Z
VREDHGSNGAAWNYLPLPEYLMEAAELAIFLVVAGLTSALFEYPDSPVHQGIPDSTVRRILVGMVMGCTAIAITYSPWGKQSGAHINPAVTIAFYRSGRVHREDAFFYIVFQFLGGLIGVQIVAWILGKIFTDAPVRYIVTVPGVGGWFPALLGELTIAFLMMMVILLISNHPRLNRWTGTCAGFLVWLYVIFESPLSGFGMNPARSFASAFSAEIWTAFWIYLIAPLMGMLIATEVYQQLHGKQAVKCAKLHHENNKRCIFRCNYKTNLSDRLPQSKS